MKKITVLLLLTALALPVFAIEGVGDFTAGLAIEGHDINAKEEAAQAAVAITPTITFSRDLIENLNLFLGLNSNLNGLFDDDKTFEIPLWEDGKTGISLNKIDLAVKYGLAVGPGTLGLGLLNRLNVPIATTSGDDPDAFSDRVRLTVGYELPAGPGSLSIALLTGFYIQDEEKGGPKDGFDYDELELDIDYNLEMGLGFGIYTWFDIPSKEDRGFAHGGTDLLISYTTESFGGGLEAGIAPDWKGSGKDKEFDGVGFSFRPYFEFYGLYEGLTLGAYIKINKFADNWPAIGAKSAEDADIIVAPGIYASFKF